MEELVKDVNHWPTWMMLIVICFIFIKNVLEMVFLFINKQRGRREDDDEPQKVSHGDIYLRLGEGTALMNSIKEDVEKVANDVSQLRQSLVDHAQSDANFANLILKKLNRLGGNHDHS